MLLLLVGGAAAGQPVDARAIDVLVQDALRAWEVPGAAVAVVKDDEVVYLKGHGVRALGGEHPVTPDTVFPLASCTKAFTTAAMAVLADEGKLAWDDPVRRHVPYFRLADPLADANVTLRDLVTHRTGLAGHDLLWYRSPLTPEERVRRIGLVPLDRPFRTSFQYQSVMYTAAGLAVASASGSPWDRFVRERLLDPLGMKGVSFTTAEAEKAPDRAAPHRRDPAGQVRPIRPYSIDAPDAAGSLNACARDLARWVRFQVGEGTFEGRRLVASAAVRETHSPQVVIRMDDTSKATHPETSQMCYGMGWVLQDYRGRHLVSHAGAIDGFRAHITLVPKARLGLVVLANLHETRMNLALSNALLDLLLGLPRKDWNRHLAGVVRKEEAASAARLKEREARRHHGTRPSRELSAYAGVYDEPAHGTARVAVERGGLVLRWSSFTCPLAHFHYDTFTTEGDLPGRPQVVFTLGADGEVEALRVLEPLGATFRRVKAPPAKPGGE